MNLERSRERVDGRRCLCARFLKVISDGKDGSQFLEVMGTNVLANEAVRRKGLSTPWGELPTLTHQSVHAVIESINRESAEILLR